MEKKPYNFQTSQADHLSFFYIEEPQNLCCGGSQNIRWMCINSDCTYNSLTCNDFECQKCKKSKDHRFCTFIQLSSLTEVLS